MNNKVIVLFGLMTVSAAFSGCGSRTPIYQKTFLLEVSRDQPPQKTSKDIALSIKGFTIDRTFGTKDLVYRKSQSEYETDFYNRFLISPDDMITEKTRSWFSNSGLFKWVLEPSSYADATHVLEGNITALYGDFSAQSLPKARMRIRFFLIRLSDKTVVFGKAYETQADLRARTAEALVESFDKCLVNILSDLEGDFQEQL